MLLFTPFFASSSSVPIQVTLVQLVVHVESRICRLHCLSERPQRPALSPHRCLHTSQSSLRRWNREASSLWIYLLSVAGRSVRQYRFLIIALERFVQIDLQLVRDIGTFRNAGRWRWRAVVLADDLVVFDIESCFTLLQDLR